jgi:hypothetical protein
VHYSPPKSRNFHFADFVTTSNDYQSSPSEKHQHPDTQPLQSASSFNTPKKNLVSLPVGKEEIAEINEIKSFHPLESKVYFFPSVVLGINVHKQPADHSIKTHSYPRAISAFDQHTFYTSFYRLDAKFWCFSGGPCTLFSYPGTVFDKPNTAFNPTRIRSSSWVLS